MRYSLLSALVVTSVIVPATHAGIVITEVMSSSGTGGTPDWFEVTNDGSSAVSLTGWKMDDGSFNIAAAVALSGISSIGAGESVIFLESAAGAGVANFRTFWGGLAGVQVGYYSGSGVSFGAATTGSSFFWGWDSMGAIDPNYSAVVSTVGTIGTQVGFVSADALGNIGSLGTAILVPAPGVAAIAGLALAIRSRRRA